MQIKTVVWLSCVLLLLSPLACSDAGNGGGGGGTGVSVDDLHGEWVGAVDEAGAAEGEEPALGFALDLEEQDGQVSGRYADTRGNSGEVSGTVDGDQVELVATHDEGETQVSGTLEGVTLTGQASIRNDTDEIIDGVLRGQKQSDEPADPDANRPPSVLLEFRTWDGSQCMLNGWATVFDLDGDTITQAGWDLGDGTTIDGEVVSHTYEAAGDYTVSFSATDSRGAERSFEFSTTASDSSTISGETGLCGSGSGSGSYAEMDGVSYDFAEIYWGDMSDEQCSVSIVESDVTGGDASLTIVNPITDGTAELGEVSDLCSPSGVGVEWACYVEDCVGRVAESGTITARSGSGTTTFEINATMREEYGEGTVTLTAVVTVEDE